MDVGDPFQVNGYVVSFAAVTGPDAEGVVHRMFTVQVVNDELPGMEMTVGLVRTIADAKELRDGLNDYIAALEAQADDELQSMLEGG